MTTHLSARLAWHDGGWNGRLCAEPHLNAHCAVLQHIRDSRDDDFECERAGQSLCELEDRLPPCSRDIGTYSPTGFSVTHRDPLEFRNLPPAQEHIPPYSCCPSPYRWMREENFRDVCESENLSIREPDDINKTSGWVFEPDRQIELLRNFWNKLEAENALIFYYCNRGNPIDENATRMIVGIGRIKEIGQQLYFGTRGQYQDSYPVWSRRITQDYPHQGVRLPYQEYVDQGHDAGSILCRVPKNALLSFSYVGEHVSDDVAVAILERAIQSIETVKSDRHVDGNWDDRLNWLNDALSEVWSNRGPFPGLGSVLQCLGFSMGTAFQRAVLNPMAKKGENPLEYTLSYLCGEKEPEAGPWQKGLRTCRKIWAKVPDRHELLKNLCRFELTPDQVQRILNPDLRIQSGINATEAELSENPYIICECDTGRWMTKNFSQPVALETIDHGMIPEGDAGRFFHERDIAHDDRRRVRAVAHAVLKEAAENGDTVLPFMDLWSRICGHFTRRRECTPDRGIIIREQDFYKNRFWVDFEHEPHLIALKSLHGLEQHIAGIIKRRAKKRLRNTDRHIDWRRALEKDTDFGKPASQRAAAAIKDQENALQTLFERKLSVLAGGAGTGKTSVLKVFLNAVESIEGRQSVLLLAPTGKARIRLATKTKRNAMTIHQFLLKQGWFQPDIFVLKEKSDKDPYPANMVIIDECSMIPADLFGTLLKALDHGPLKRLILVGDPYQLPPIGPGRPFVDVIEWLDTHNRHCIASLSVCMRTADHHSDIGRKSPDTSTENHSMALTFAESYRNTDVTPGDDEVLADLAAGKAGGDLEIVYWDGHDDLMEKLKKQMATLLNIGDNDYAGFNCSLGIDTKQWAKSEAWQILSPARIHYFGTDELNRLIQREYKGGLIKRGQNFRSGQPKPFGEQEIVWTDKVIQVFNRSFEGWPRNTGLDYVANGEIGIVTRSVKRKNSSDYVQVIFSTQTGVSYRYYRSEVDDNLELAYALTVHKAQGSDFDVVFLIIPQSASTLSRELIYTGLTRFKKKLVLLVERDIQPLLTLRNPDQSATRLRNTRIFELSIRSENQPGLYPEALIHRTQKGTAVRSKSEVIVADILDSLGLSYEYEKPLYSKTNPVDFRLPDFTVSFEGDIFYWEHLGMLNLPHYRQAWERKRKWYEENGYADQLLTSEDGEDGSIDAEKIKKIARSNILEEDE